MGTRADLLATAAHLASVAKVASSGDEAAQLAVGAKIALEAAALAQDVGGGEIDQALSGIQDLLEEAGVLADSFEMAPEKFMEATFRALVAWRNEGLAAQGYQVAYGRMRELCERLQYDFVVGGTPTSLRIAERIQAAFDAVDDVLKQAKIGAGDGQQEDAGEG